MKFLFANKFFYPAGGQEVYLRELSAILAAHGHEVVPFAMRHPKNWPTPYEKYFTGNVDYGDTSIRKNQLGKVGALVKSAYSAEARKKIDKLLEDTRPDIAHLFSIAYQLTPSIIYPIRKRGIPIVISVNEYKLVCPNQRLYIQHKYEICEKCVGSRYYSAPLKKCIKDSYIASAVGALETYLYERLGTYRKHVDIFVVATDFMAELLKGVGIAPEKIRKLHNPLRLSGYTPSYENEGYVLYFGRLSEDKGVKTLLDAVRRSPEVMLKVVGGGKEEPSLKDMVRSWGARNIEFLGPVWDDDMKRLLAGAKFIVVPSEWYENSPYVIYQSFAMGKPVVGSDIKGGIPELVKDGENGLLFRPCDAGDLKAKITRLYNDDERVKAMGKRARLDAESLFGEENSYANFMDVYEGLLERRQR